MTLETNLARPVSETMTPHVATLEADITVQEAARILANNRVSGMPVVNELGVVVGVVTLTDFVTALGKKATTEDEKASVPAEESDGLFYDSVRLVELMGELIHPLTDGSVRTVADIMSSRLVTVRLTEPTRIAAQIMAKRRVHRLLVLDENGKLAGIVSALDIVQLVAED